MKAERPPGKNSFAAGIIGRLCPVLLMAALSSCNALVKVPGGADSLAETPPAKLTGLERLRFTVENLGEVEPGLLYRSANPGPNLLGFLAKRVGLKYVINLRSSTDPSNAAFMESIGGRIFSLPMSASRPPRPDQVLEFIRITQLARREGAAILVHCMAGADRTGMMVGAWRMLFQGVRDRGALTRETRMYRHLPLAWPNVHRYIKSFRPELFQQFIDDPALLDDEVRSSELEKNFLQGYPLTGGKRKVTSGPLRAGTASVDLVGDWSGPLQLATYGPSPPRALGVRQPVEARALVLDNGSTRLALVSCDLLIMHRQLRQAVLKKLAAGGTSLDGILLSATHTHTSLGAYIDDPLFEFYMLGPYDPKWADHLAGRISRAITRAAGSLQEARLGCGRTFISGASYNRRRGPVTDPELVLVKITDAGGKPLALLANFAGHPILEPDDAMLSPDYPGILSRKIDERYGFGFFLQGALGDLNAGSEKERHEWKKEGLAEKVAEGLYQAIGGVYERIPVKAEVKLASLTTSFRLPEVNFNLLPDLLFPLEWAFKALADWPRDFPLQGIRIGDAAILATASELSCGLGLQVKRNSPAPFTLVASHCGDYAGYALPQHDHAHTKLDASALVALGSPAHGPHLVESSAGLLAALWDGAEKPPAGPPLSPAARHRIKETMQSLTEPERKRFLLEASAQEEDELGLSPRPALPQGRSLPALVGHSRHEGLRIDLSTSWRSRVRGASGSRGDIDDSSLKLSTEIPGDLDLDLRLGYRSASWELDGLGAEVRGARDLELGVEKIYTLSSERINGNALRLIPRLQLSAPTGDADSETPFAFTTGYGTWRAGGGGGLEFTWNTFRTLRAQALYTTTLDSYHGREPGDRWDGLLGYSERHGFTSLNLAACGTLWGRDRREGGLTTADLAETSWETSLRPGLSLHLADNIELFIEGRLPLSNSSAGAGGGRGIFIGLVINP
jgi:hypothetical protein